MLALAAALLVVFVGGLYFITHNKPEDAPLLPAHTTRPGNGLPPKPEERWRYIKELENRQIGVQTPTEPTAGGELNSKTQLTAEQRQLLEQMQADMQQRPTQLNEVPYNDPGQPTRAAPASSSRCNNSKCSSSRYSNSSRSASRRATRSATGPLPRRCSSTRSQNRLSSNRCR